MPTDTVPENMNNSLGKRKTQRDKQLRIKYRRISFLKISDIVIHREYITIPSLFEEIKEEHENMNKIYMIFSNVRMFSKDTNKILEIKL